MCFCGCRPKVTVSSEPSTRTPASQSLAETHLFFTLTPVRVTRKDDYSSVSSKMLSELMFETFCLVVFVALTKKERSRVSAEDIPRAAVLVRTLSF